MKYTNNRFYKAWASMPAQADITRSWNARQIAAANASKIRTLSKQVYRNRGELKVKHNQMVSTTMPNASAATLELTLVEQGDDIYHREGNHIYCKGFNINMLCSAHDIDAYVVLSKNGTTPSYGDFQNRVGGFLYATQRSEFVVLGTLRTNGTFSFTPGDTIASQRSIRKKIHIPTFYNGVASGTGVRNRIFILVKNDTGVVQGYTVTVELFFRDN